MKKCGWGMKTRGAGFCANNIKPIMFRVVWSVACRRLMGNCFWRYYRQISGRFYIKMLVTHIGGHGASFRSCHSVEVDFRQAWTFHFEETFATVFLCGTGQKII